VRVVGDVEAHSVDKPCRHVEPKIALGTDVLVFLAGRVRILAPEVEDVLVSYNQLERVEL